MPRLVAIFSSNIYLFSINYNYITVHCSQVRTKKLQMVGETGHKRKGMDKYNGWYYMYVLTYVSLPISVVVGYNWWGHIALT